MKAPSLLSRWLSNSSSHRSANSTSNINQPMSTLREHEITISISDMYAYAHTNRNTQLNAMPSSPYYYSPPRKSRSWLQRKFLIFEVTFGPGVMSPGEKFTFYAFLFLFLSLLIAAVSLYLPTYLESAARRTYFYLFGDDSLIREFDVLEYSGFEVTRSAAQVADAAGFARDTVNTGLAVAGFSLVPDDVKSYMG
ncbi:hypothetical protein TWF694_003773 [Orbilia ellipsospora]|uniref:Uncharacterized protein n=1 Tax=Orbilia ellipsospora TaxID=2528407 RepID=A0AAV9X1F1_9PEZI